MSDEFERAVEIMKAAVLEKHGIRAGEAMTTALRALAPTHWLVEKKVTEGMYAAYIADCGTGEATGETIFKAMANRGNILKGD